jgi:hypothetical protein
MQKSLWVLLTVLLGASAGIARADVVTLDVTGSLTPSTVTAMCTPVPCTLGGDIVLDPATGTILSVDVTMSGASPSVGPFTVFDSAGFFLNDQLFIQFSSAGYAAQLYLRVPCTTDCIDLVGYAGGTILGGNVTVSPPGPLVQWSMLTGTGALTPAVGAVPEPRTITLMLLGVGLVFAMRKRIAQGLQQAS